MAEDHPAITVTRAASFCRNGLWHLHSDHSRMHTGSPLRPPMNAAQNGPGPEGHEGLDASIKRAVGSVLQVPVGSSPWFVSVCVCIMSLEYANLGSSMGAVV